MHYSTAGSLTAVYLDTGATARTAGGVGLGSAAADVTAALGAAAVEPFMGDLWYPAALDTKAAIKTYFSTNDLPATLLLDLQTMRIVYKATGSQAELVEAAIKAHLK